MKRGAWRGADIGWWGGVGLWLVVGCSATNPAFEVASTSGGSESTAGASGDSMSAGETTQTSAMSGSGGGSTGPGSSTSLDGSTGPEVCESGPLHSEDYPRCNDSLCSDGADCIESSSPEPVEYDLSVCAPSCLEDCDCPAPAQAQAQPRCDEGRCALDCSDDQPCPGAMVCDEGLCLRVDAYGPCGNSCLSGYCFGFVEMGMFTDYVCPVVDCLDEGGVPDSAVCPPPPDGNAVPLCFEPQEPPELQGTGWCVLRCAGGETCPQGMECIGNDCLHPA